ncbi:MAG: Fic family protein, partial [Micrococcales bacterium]|nr:Fic family protein [Micrococcales bacterium]
ELKDYMEVLGYGEASRWVFEQASSARSHDSDRLVTLTELRQLHHVAMTRVWQVAPHPAAEPGEAPGSFRRHEIAPFPRGMKPPTFPVVPSMVDTWLEAVNTFGDEVTTGRLALADAPAHLAQIHAEFERIHPFLDGNGRTGRLVLNLIICRLGWAPVVILKSQRRRYLNALMRADTGDHAALAEIIARASVASLHRLLPRLCDTSDLVPLRALADDRVSLDALRRAVARRRLDATMDAHGTWRSTRAAVEEYLATRHRRT